MSKGNNQMLYKWNDQINTINTQTKEDEQVDTLQRQIEDPIQAEARKKAEEQSKKTSLKFRDRGRMLSNAEYTYLSDGEQVGAKRTKQSKYMKPVTDALGALDALLSEDHVNLDKAKDISEAFLNVCMACETYIKNRNPWTDEGKARKQMVQDFYEQVSWESTRFSERIEELKNSPEQVEAYDNWGDLLADVRTEKYENGKDGVVVTKGGAGTSEIYIVEKDGEKKYFKENEDLPSDDYRELFDKEIEAISQQEEAYQGEDKEEQQKRFAIRKRILTAAKEFMVYNFGSSKSSAIGLILNSRDEGNLFVEMRMLERKAKINGKSDMQSLASIMDAYSEEEFTQEDAQYVTDAFWNIRKALLMHEIATGDAKIEEGSKMSKRNVATTRMAEMLGIKDLIVPTKMTELVINGKKMRGILMDDANGVCLPDLKEKVPGKKLKYSPEVLKSVLSLQVFDLICGQVDRNGANYLGRTKADNKNVVDRIIGIDNDLAFGKLSYKDISKKGLRGLNRIRNIETGGEFTLPAMDKSLADAILALEPAIINYRMCDILSIEERKALIDRITGVQKAILKRMEYEEKRQREGKKYEKKFISTEEQWEEKRLVIQNGLQTDRRKAENYLTQISYLRSDYI